jgi:hypothetical protein
LSEFPQEEPPGSLDEQPSFAPPPGYGQQSQPSYLPPQQSYGQYPGGESHSTRNIILGVIGRSSSSSASELWPAS